MTDGDRGTVDVLLLAALLGASMIPAVLLAHTIDALDAAAGRVVLYAAAAAAAWKLYRVVSTLLGLDARLKALEQKHEDQDEAPNGGADTGGSGCST